jgi:ribosomal-protein-alanine N-acetyltransferase
MTQQPLPYTIRPMQPGDIPTVVAIDQLSFPTPWSASSYAYELRNNKVSSYYVLLKPTTGGAALPKQGWRQWLLGVMSLSGRESPVIGYVGFRLRGPDSHISTIAVHPDWRGNGLGELLLLTALEEVLAQGRRSVTLEVRASNHMAQQMYRKYGFRFTGVHQGYYQDGEDAWLMAASLDAVRTRTRLAELRQALETRLRDRASRSHTSSGQNGADTL